MMHNMTPLNMLSRTPPRTQVTFVTVRYAETSKEVSVVLFEIRLRGLLGVKSSFN